MTFGSPGIGTSIHVSGELFKTMTGIADDARAVQGPAVRDPRPLGGQIQLMFDNMPSALPMVKEGKLRALGADQRQALGGRARHARPIAEQGLPGFEATSWFAVFAPAGTPRDVVMRLNGELKRVFSLPDVQEKLKALGLEPWLSTPEELAKYQGEEIVKWAKVVKESGAKAD